MKKHILLFAAAILSLSCSKEETFDLSGLQLMGSQYAAFDYSTETLGVEYDVYSVLYFDDKTNGKIYGYSFYSGQTTGGERIDGEGSFTYSLQGDNLTINYGASKYQGKKLDGAVEIMGEIFERVNWK